MKTRLQKLKVAMPSLIKNSKKWARKYFAYLVVFFIVGLCLGLEWWWSRPQGKQRPVCAALQAQVPIEAGDALHSRLVQVRFVAQPTDARCEQLYFTESQLDMSDWVAAHSVAQGQTLYPQDVQAMRVPRLPRGRRAFAATVESNIAVRPGQYVEVYSRQSNQMILGASLVLEVGKGSPLQLVLALRTNEIRAMEKAARQGTLSVALVHPEDVRSYSKPNSDFRTGRVKHRSAAARVWNEE